MNLPMYQNLRKLASTPYERYTGHLQALINERWENSTQTHFEVFQEMVIGSGEYSPVNVSIDTAIDIGTGFKKGDDFKVFSHKNIEGQMPLGTMFKTDKDYWLCINTNGYASPTNSCEVRRCNEIMKWVDPLDGYVYQQYCCVDYELSSPRPSKDKDIVVADGHIFVYVQGNERTRKIRKNQRFIFNGQPYKLSAYQTLLDEDSTTDYSNLLYIDMYLDTVQPTDDLVNGIANITDYNYAVVVTPNLTQQAHGYVGQLIATVLFNGETVERELIWTSNEYAVIDEASGTFTLTGEVGSVATIRATLAGNPDVYDEFHVHVVRLRYIIVTDRNEEIVTSLGEPIRTDGVEDDYMIGISPLYEEVLHMKPATFNVYLYKNGVQQDDEVTWEYSGLSDKYFTMVQDGHMFTLSVKDISDTPLTLTFSCRDMTRTISVLLKPFF